jgi:hypothetical protein
MQILAQRPDCEGHGIFAMTSMEKKAEAEILQEMSLLLEKMAVDSFVPVLTDSDTAMQHAEAVLLNLKSINARYDKHEAITQVQALMERYNIQIDELLEQVHH